MFISKNNKVHAFFALFFLTVLMSTILIKPFHIFVEHHQLPDIKLANTDHTLLSNSGNTDCPICDFEFCSFISADKVVIQKNPESFVDNIISQTTDCLIQQSSHNFLLRAPPAL